MRAIAEKACELLAEKQMFVMATIISHHGSTPRSAGTQMVISADGTGFGTIGGGLLEARVISAAATVLSYGRPTLLQLELTPAEAAATDMICGGGLEVLLSLHGPGKDTAVVFNRWQQSLATGHNGLFFIHLRRAGKRIEDTGCGLILADGTVFGALPVAAADLADSLDTARRSGCMQRAALENGELIVIPNRIGQRLYVFGAGHVAQPTVHMAAVAGFRVTVLDDRAEFASIERFPDAHQARVLPDFGRAFTDLPVDGDTYIVIATRGHLHDRTVLAQALTTQARYIGMIGSRKKRDAIYKALMGKGFVQKDIARVHSPIGLAIGAETPEEIAVSIVSELVAVRAGVIE